MQRKTANKSKPSIPKILLHDSDLDLKILKKCKVLTITFRVTLVDVDVISTKESTLIGCTMACINPKE